MDDNRVWNGWISRAPRFLSILRIMNGGAPAVIFCFVWLYISAAGPGPWSIDALRRRRAEAGAK
jgi:putative oxidoreductase